MISRRGLLASALACLPGCMPGAEAGALSRPLDLAALPPGGPIRLLGGLEIDTRVLGFGGLSALHLADDLTLTMVSDLGRFAEMRLALDAGLRPVSLSLLRAGPLRDGAGQPLARGHAGDSESLVRLSDGTWLVGFERWHRIRAYRTLSSPGTYVEAPPRLELAPANAGLESLAVLPDGRLVAIAEEFPPGPDASLTSAWIGRPGAWRPIAYRPGANLLPVDAAALPDGALLVVERSFSIFGGFSGRLVRVPAAQLANPAIGAVLEGEELLRLSAPIPSDNYEGLAVLRRDGRTLLALISDDNENRLQRTLLLVLELLG
ncbi:esterase-like activity of phytase family protein [Falsiroseomonas sp.]|uniref:esterase-like activity of phytase family protein n=1 Tax=Falsiroseomonas sp. TaxID=2870721 RepID=UPI003F709BD1